MSGLWCCTEYIPEDTCSYKGSLSQALWRFDSTELKEVIKVLQLCCSEASRLVLNSLFCFLFGFGEVEDLMLDFGFLSIFQLLQLGRV